MIPHKYEAAGESWLFWFRSYITKPLPGEIPLPGSETETKDAVEDGKVEQQDANVLNKKKLSTDDIKVKETPEKLEIPVEVMSQLSSLPDGGEIEFGHNNEPENDIEAVKDEVLNGPTQEESATDESDSETVLLESQETKEEAPQGGETQGPESKGPAVKEEKAPGPFQSAVDRGLYVAGKMIDGIKDFWSKNKATIIAALIGVIAGVILANILTGGAVMAAIPLIMEIASVYFAAETMYNVMGYLGSYLGDSWVGQIAKGAVNLARAFAIGAIELVMALLFGGKAFLKGAKNVAKTAQKGGVKGVAKLARNAAKKEAKMLMKNSKRLAAVTRRGARNTVKNGKLMYKGLKNGAVKGAKNLDDMGKKLLKKMRFKKFKIQIQKRRFKLLGEINPWVLLASGEVVHVESKKVKGKKVGDNYKDGIIVGMKDADGGSAYVKRLRNDPVFNQKISSLIGLSKEKGILINPNELVKGLSIVSPSHLDEVIDSIENFKHIPGIEKVVQDLSKRGGKFTIGATFVLTFLNRNKKIAEQVTNFEEAVQILGNLSREIDVVLKGKGGWLEFKHWATFRRKSFLSQMVKDIHSPTPITWIFSNGMGSLDEVKALVTSLLKDKKYLEKHLDPETIKLLTSKSESILKSIRVADFHITF